MERVFLVLLVVGCIVSSGRAISQVDRQRSSSLGTASKDVPQAHLASKSKTR